MIFYHKLSKIKLRIYSSLNYYIFYLIISKK